MPKHYEPPRMILFKGSGPLPVGIGFSCDTGPQAKTGTCSAGWTASTTCKTGCTAQGCPTNGCVNGPSASCDCSSGTTIGNMCGLTVCCDGSNGSNWPTCIPGTMVSFGACYSGGEPCGGECLTLDLCNPPS